jgi:hypothetical protein
MTQIVEKDKSLLNSYFVAGHSAISEIKLLCKQFNVSTIDLTKYDVYIHAHTDDGGIELRLLTLSYNPIKEKITLVGNSINGENISHIDLEDNCLLVDALFIYEALVDYINDNPEAYKDIQVEEEELIYHYMVNVPGLYGYSFLVRSKDELDENEVIDVCASLGYFTDNDDRHYAYVDDLVTDYDIERMESATYDI